MKKYKSKKIMGMLLVAMMLTGSFMCGQAIKSDIAFAAVTSLPAEGTIMEASAGRYEYIAQADGIVNVTITSGYGGTGGVGGWSVNGDGSIENGTPGITGSTGSSHGNGGTGGTGNVGGNDNSRKYGSGGNGGAGGGGTGILFKIDGRNTLAANGGNGGAGGIGGVHQDERPPGMNPPAPPSEGVAGITKTLSTPIQKGQVIIIEPLNASDSTGGNVPGGAGGTAVKSGWSFTLQTSKKVLTESDGFEASSRQAAAMERMAAAFEKMVSGGIGTGGAPTGTPMVSVIEGKAFNTFVTGEKSTLGTWKSGEVSLINNDLNDNYIQFVGVLKSSGQKEILFDGTKYIFNVIQEPDSSNVSVILN